MSTGFHLHDFGAGSYFADFGTPSRDLVRRASFAVNVFWFELEVEFSCPPFGYLPFPFEVSRLSCKECVAFAAVQSAIRDDLGHDSHCPSLDSIRASMVHTHVIRFAQADDG